MLIGSKLFRRATTGPAGSIPPRALPGCGRDITFFAEHFSTCRKPARALSCQVR